MKKKSKIYNIAKKPKNIQNECHGKHCMFSYSTYSAYYGSQNLCMHNFKRHGAIMEGTNNYDELGYYIGNNDKHVYYRFYNNDG